jgi:hypothetical protein
LDEGAQREFGNGWRRLGRTIALNTFGSKYALPLRRRDRLDAARGIASAVRKKA